MNKNTVDRTYENSPEDAEITVTLADGYTERFWLIGLTDDEYIERTIAIRESSEIRSEIAEYQIELKEARQRVEFLEKQIEINRDRLFELKNGIGDPPTREVSREDLGKHSH